MREIKFRAWDTEESKWLQGNRVEIFQTAIGFPESIILLQYTGLKDKNGKEIYEGDIINPNLRVVSIEDPFIKELEDGDIITQGMGVYTLCFNPEYPRSKFSFGRTQAQSSEVIGNIYENPELAEESNHAG